MMTAFLFQVKSQRLRKSKIMILIDLDIYKKSFIVICIERAVAVKLSPPPRFLSYFANVPLCSVAIDANNIIIDCFQQQRFSFTNIG